MREDAVVVERHCRFGSITDSRATNLIEMIADRVLRDDRQRHHQDSALGQSVKERIDIFANRALCRQVPNLWRPSQALYRHHRMRPLVEPPGTRFRVRARHRECQAFGKFGAEGQRIIAGIRRQLRH